MLVLGARVEPFPALHDAQRRTWAATPPGDVETIFYFGGDRLSFAEDELVLPVSDARLDISRKTLACFEWALENRDFDLVFRTNSSSYVDLPNLCRRAREQGRRERFYSGFIGAFDERGIFGLEHKIGPDAVERMPFASGSGYFLSRDLVRYVVNHRGTWRHDWRDSDDAALAEMVSRIGIVPEAAPRVDYTDVREVRNVDTTQHHFRCRTRTPGRRGDILIMERIHRAFCEARGVRVPRRNVVRRVLGR